MKAKLGVTLTLLLVAVSALKGWPGSEMPKWRKAGCDLQLRLKEHRRKGSEFVAISREKALLLVNVASQCGYTPQYEGLQKIYAKYKDEGLVVLGFPANNFGDQEPGIDQEIKTFCLTRYSVTFPMFSKISV